MNIETGDLITAGDYKFITLEKLMYKNKEYLITNRVLSNNELTDEFYILLHEDTKLKKIMEKEILDSIIPEFEKLLKRDLKVML